MVSAKLEKMLEELKMYENILNTFPHPFAVINPKTFEVIKANLSYYNGENPEEKHHCYELSHKLKSPCSDTLECPIKTILSTKTHNPLILNHIHSKNDGTNYCAEITATPIFDKDGNLIYITEFFKDITDKQKTEEEIKWHANHDHLTQLPNRKYFYENTQQNLSRRNTDKYALFFIDLDGFKEINDTYGHNIGDEILIETSRRLKTIIRNEDIISRYGGDEFTIMIQDYNKVKDLETIAKKVLTSIKVPYLISNDNQEIKIEISASIGITTYKKNIDLDRLIQQADSAMYEAKNKGKNQYVITSPINT